MWPFGWKGPSGFSARSTAEEVTHGIDGTDLTAIVTGASSGIGEETTRVLALRGVHVIMAVRNTDSGNKIREAILKEIPEAQIDVMELDLSSMASVRTFASEYNSSGLPLNLLINNAGIMACPFMLSTDNIELQFATNHLGHFLLTNLLLETMKKTAHETGKEGRIVNVSSEGHRFAYWEGVRFDKINDESSYNALQAYGQSKLCNILHANELARQLKEEGVKVTANSLHPGSIMTNLLRYHSFINTYGTEYKSNRCIEMLCSVLHDKSPLSQSELENALENCLGVQNSNIVCLFDAAIGNMVVKYVLKSIPQGASTTCFVALHPQTKGVTGEYFMDNNISKPNSQAKDGDLGKKLWEFSLKLTNPE